MPYGNVSELPTEIRERLPVRAQEIYLSAFNRAYDSTCNGNRNCSDISAWSQVRRFYEVNDTEVTLRKPLGKGAIISKHEVILNSLDRFVDGLYFGKENFEQTNDLWDRIPLIYATEHAELDEFARNPERELERIGGAIVGEFVSPRIEVVGHPSFRGDFVFTDDVPLGDRFAAIKAVNLLKEGRLSHSSAFISPENKNGELSAPPMPNHVLVFEEITEDGRVPRDKGSAVLNMKSGDTLSNTNSNDEQKLSSAHEAKLGKIFSDLRSFIVTLAGKEPEMSQDELKKEQQKKEQKNQETNMTDEKLAEAITQLNTEKKILSDDLLAKNTVITGLESKVAELEGKVTEFKNMETERAKSQADQKWVEAKKLLPIGVTNTEEKESVARKMFEEDKDAFYLQAISQKNQKSEEEEGSEFPGRKNQDEEKDPELIAAEKEWEMM